MSEQTSAGAPGGTGVPGITPGYRRYALFMLVVVYTSSFVDRQIMGVLLEPVKLDLGLSDTQMGFMTGLAFALFYATLGMPVAFLADRWNRRNIIAIAVAIWSLMTALGGLAIGFWTLAIARIGVGVGEAGASPPAHSMLADMYPEKERAGALGIYSLGIYFGIMIGFLAGAYVAEYYGWRAAFFVVGLPGLIIAVLVRYTMIEPQRGAADGLEPSDPEPIDWSKMWGEIVIGFKHLLSDPVSRNVVFGIMLVAFVGYGGTTWIAAFFIRSHGMSLIEVGTYLAFAIGIFGGLGAFMGGRMADRATQKHVAGGMWIVSVGMLAAAPLVVWFFLETNLTIALIVYLPTLLLGAFYLGPSFAMIQTRAPLKMRALASAIMLFIVNLVGMGLGPQAVGILSDVLAPEFGKESLRYSLLILSFAAVWGAWHYYLAGRHLVRIKAQAAATPAE
ncbi:MFS transporter [Pyruvatibacter sp.]|uniref:spinster family MFS transporter n=1 Tax=Pyruvatibacter sp. TaxID=1981328 RepID=UPI0032EB29C7